MNTIVLLPKRLTLPEPATEHAVKRWRNDVAKFLQDVAWNATLTRYDAGQVATGLVRLAANPADGDTLTVTSGTFVVIYEFDNTAAITIGRVPVPIGGSAAATAANLATALIAAQGMVVTAVQHPTDTTVVDIAARQAGATLTVAESTSGVRLTVQDNANEVTPDVRYQFATRRTVTALDVTRGRVVIQTALGVMRWYQVLIQTSAAVPTVTPYNGVVTVSAGTIELTASGGSDLVAGNIIVVSAEGTR